MRRLRLTPLGSMITTVSLAIGAGTSILVYIWVVPIGGHSDVADSILIGGMVALLLALGDRLLLREARRRSRTAARRGGPQGRRRGLRDPDPGRLLRTARPARPHFQRDAAPPRRAGQRPQTVHRQRLARAAHADLQPRRLRRAARRGGAQPRGAGRVRADDAPADRAPHQAHHRPPQPLAARRRWGRARPRQRRPQLAGARGGARVRALGRPARLAARAANTGAPCDRLRRPRTGAADHPYPARQRPHPHPGGGQRDRDHLLRQPPCRADRLRRRRRYPATRPEAPLRALLHGRLRRRLWARPGDRQRGGPADGGQHGDLLEPAVHRLHARPAAGPRRDERRPAFGGRRGPRA